MPSDHDPVADEAEDQRGFLKTAINAVGWNAANLLLGFPVKLGLSLLLMRFLDPQIYGTLAIPLVILAICDTAVRCGFQNSLIHHSKPDRSHYTSIMFVNVAIAIVLYGLILLGSIVIEVAYPIADIGVAMRWVGIALILRSTFLVQIADASIRLNFKKQSLIEFSSYVLAYALAIGMAVQGWGLPSLITFYVATPVIALILYWSTTTWLPRLSEIRLSVIRSHWSYAKNILGQEVVDTFTNRVDLIIVGSVVSPTSLGLFSKAKDYSELLTTSSSKLFSRPAFALFARIKGDAARHRMYFLQSLGLVAGMYSVLVAIVVVNCGVVLDRILTPEWNGVSLLLQVLVISSLFYVPSIFSRYILLSRGAARTHLFMTLCKSALRIIGLGGLAIFFRSSEEFILLVAGWEVVVAALEFLLIGVMLEQKLNVSVRTLLTALSDAGVFCLATSFLLVMLSVLHSRLPVVIANVGIACFGSILLMRMSRKNELLRDCFSLGYRKLLKPQTL